MIEPETRPEPSSPPSPGQSFARGRTAHPTTTAPVPGTVDEDPSPVRRGRAGSCCSDESVRSRPRSASAGGGRENAGGSQPTTPRAPQVQRRPSQTLRPSVTRRSSTPAIPAHRSSAAPSLSGSMAGFPLPRPIDSCEDPHQGSSPRHASAFEEHTKGGAAVTPSNEAPHHRSRAIAALMVDSDGDDDGTAARQPAPVPAHRAPPQSSGTDVQPAAPTTAAGAAALPSKETRSHPEVVQASDDGAPAETTSQPFTPDPPPTSSTTNIAAVGDGQSSTEPQQSSSKEKPVQDERHPSANSADHDDSAAPSSSAPGAAAPLPALSRSSARRESGHHSAVERQPRGGDSPVRSSSAAAVPPGGPSASTSSSAAPVTAVDRETSSPTKRTPSVVFDHSARSAGDGNGAFQSESHGGVATSSSLIQVEQKAAPAPPHYDHSLVVTTTAAGHTPPLQASSSYTTTSARALPRGRLPDDRALVVGFTSPSVEASRPGRPLPEPDGAARPERRDRVRSPARPAATNPRHDGSVLRHAFLGQDGRFVADSDVAAAVDPWLLSALASRQPVDAATAEAAAPVTAALTSVRSAEGVRPHLSPNRLDPQANSSQWTFHADEREEKMGDEKSNSLVVGSRPFDRRPTSHADPWSSDVLSSMVDFSPRAATNDLDDFIRDDFGEESAYPQRVVSLAGRGVPESPSRAGPASPTSASLTSQMELMEKLYHTRHYDARVAQATSTSFDERFQHQQQQQQQGRAFGGDDRQRRRKTNEHARTDSSLAMDARLVEMGDAELRRALEHRPREIARSPPRSPVSSIGPQRFSPPEALLPRAPATHTSRSLHGGLRSDVDAGARSFIELEREVERRVATNNESHNRTVRAGSITTGGARREGHDVAVAVPVPLSDALYGPEGHEIHVSGGRVVPSPTRRGQQGRDRQSRRQSERHAATTTVARAGDGVSVVPTFGAPSPKPLNRADDLDSTLAAVDDMLSSSAARLDTSAAPSPAPLTDDRMNFSRGIEGDRDRPMTHHSQRNHLQLSDRRMSPEAELSRAAAGYVSPTFPVNAHNGVFSEIAAAAALASTPVPRYASSADRGQAAVQGPASSVRGGGPTDSVVLDRTPQSHGPALLSSSAAPMPRVTPLHQQQQQQSYSRTQQPPHQLHQPQQHQLMSVSNRPSHAPPHEAPWKVGSSAAAKDAYRRRTAVANTDRLFV